MEASYYIGIDISKQRLDWQLTDAQNTEIATNQAGNTPNGINKMIGRWKREKICLDELIVCFEHTGPYGLLLATILEQVGICYVMVSAAQVQLSLGIRRGGNLTLLMRSVLQNTSGASGIACSLADFLQKRCLSYVGGCCGGRS